ncbi:MAG: hypothetical protein CM15mP102_10130 [Flavobacteriales bacterium]|nr:MAG: hypothetical protein CM15mP102_10130 [Flavobacteriales bacterium]
MAYRGAWLEWDIHEIDMAVPMSPAQVLRKEKQYFSIKLKRME